MEYNPVKEELEQIKNVLEEVERFKKSLKLLEKGLKSGEIGSSQSSKIRASAKRASLDLSRVLSGWRKPIWN